MKLWASNEFFILKFSFSYLKRDVAKKSSSWLKNRVEHGLLFTFAAVKPNYKNIFTSENWKKKLQKIEKNWKKQQTFVHCIGFYSKILKQFIMFLQIVFRQILNSPLSKKNRNFS